MKLLPYYKNKIKRAWRVRFGRDKSFEIELLPLVTPERLYQDCQYVVDSEDWCDDYGEIYYLRDGVRKKTDEIIIGTEYSIGFNNDALQVVLEGTMKNYMSFLDHPGLLPAIEKILNTPFLVTLYDLNTEKKSCWSWYKTRIAVLKDTADDWTGKPFANAVLKELERIGMELRIFCRRAMEYISTIVMQHIHESVNSARLGNLQYANMSMASAKDAYADMIKKVQEVNITLRHVKNALDQMNIHHVIDLEKAHEKISWRKIAPFKA